MRQVMWDMMRADEYVSHFVMKDSTKRKKDELEKMYDEIFRLHGITQGQFKRSFDYYTSSPELFRPIIDSLGKQKGDYKPYFAQPGTAKDSLIKFTHPINKLPKDSAAKAATNRPRPIR